MAARAFWTLCLPGNGNVNSDFQSGARSSRSQVWTPACPLYFRGAEVRIFRKSESQNSSRKTLGKLPHALIVFVQNRHRVRSRWSRDNRSTRAWPARSHRPNRKTANAQAATLVTTPTCGSANRARRAISPAADMAKFHHRHIVLRFQPQQRQRQSIVIVQVSRRAQHAKPPAEDGRDHFLRGALSGAARDRHKPLAPLAANLAGKRLQCAVRVRQPQSVPAAIPPERWRRRPSPPPRRPRRVRAPAPTNLCPSNRGPRMAKKSCPGASERESMEYPSTRRSATPDDVSKRSATSPNVNFMVDCQLLIARLTSIVLLDCRRKN